MKKGLKILAIMVATLIYLPYIKAETTITQKIDNSMNNKNEINENTINYIYNELIPSKQGYKYYIWYNEDSNLFDIIFYEYVSNLNFDISQEYLKINIILNKGEKEYIVECYEGNNFSCTNIDNQMGTTIMTNITNDEIYEPFYTLYDTNDNIINNIQPIELTGFYNDTIVINKGDIFPTLKNLYQYSSWSEYENNHTEGYTEVNLDNYEYVLLSLKDYNQTKAFQTNLQVKGQIGITPIYNYGQAEKDVITDRCNVNYENYTSYPFYILSSDLENNSVYAVKECSSGSSFKFDNSIFDITYVTDSNKDDPIITINGNYYHTIPFNNLSNSANSNEENNLIPGETSSKSFSDVVKEIPSYLSSFWDSVTAFMSLVTKFFNSFPLEIRAVLITSFTTMCTLGIIKILKA